MNKKGQFFLIAAVVIVGIIVTLSAINISTKTPEKENEAFYDLSREISFESNKLIDYGVYNREQGGVGNTDKSITALVSNYSAAYPDTDMLFIYGNKEDLTIVFYNRTSLGGDSLNTGGGDLQVQQYTRTPIIPRYTSVSNNITVYLPDGTPLSFQLGERENFFIVLKKEIGDETFVAKE